MQNSISVISSFLKKNSISQGLAVVWKYTLLCHISFNSGKVEEVAKETQIEENLNVIQDELHADLNRCLNNNKDHPMKCVNPVKYEYENEYDDIKQKEDFDSLRLKKEKKKTNERRIKVGILPYPKHLFGPKKGDADALDALFGLKKEDADGKVQDKVEVALDEKKGKFQRLFITKLCNQVRSLSLFR